MILLNLSSLPGYTLAPIHTNKENMLVTYKLRMDELQLYALTILPNMLSCLGSTGMPTAILYTFISTSVNKHATGSCTLSLIFLKG